MAVRGTMYKRFQKAMTGFVASSAALVTATSHTSGLPRIYARKNSSDIAVPSVTLSFSHEGPLIPDVDDGILETRVQIDCWHSSDLASMDMLGAVEALVMQSPTTNLDASFNSDGIRTEGMRPLAPLRVGVEDAEEAGVYVSTAVVVVRWLDTQVP